MTDPLRIGSEKQLFIDDYCIGELRGTRRRFHQATKHPANPLMTPREPWEETYVQLYGNALYDETMQIFRMWYSARYAPDGRGSSLNTVCHATSKDGIHWERSRLNLLEHKGLVLSNAVLKGHYIGPTVFHTPEDPDLGRKYRMFVYTGAEILNQKDRSSAFAYHYGVLFSPDGFAWTPYEHNPVIQGGDISTCAYDPVAQEYIAFPKIHRTDAGVYRRCVGASTSKDFLKWDTPCMILSADETDDARVDARLARFRDLIIYDDPSYYHADMYGMTGFRYEGLRLGLIWFYDISALRPTELGGNDDGIVNVQLAYARGDNALADWHRVGDRADFIPCGDDGEYDCASLYTAHTVLEREDELWFYYTGVSRSHGWQEHVPHKCLSTNPVLPCSLNLATLRRDGFASIETLYPGGRMTTKLLSLEGERLVINADAENGHIEVELTDSEGKPIPGYTKDECVPFCRDDVRGEIQWQGGRSLAALKARPAHIVFHMQTARLYSFKVC